MSVAKAVDVESVCFSAPDLKQMREFLIDFGLREAEDVGDGVLRMRGTAPLPYIHETVEGAPGFRSLAIRVRHMADLKALADASGAPIEAPHAPGSGHRVRMTDPNGFTVDAVAGKTDARPQPHGSRDPWNVIARRERAGVAKRVAAGPASVVRLGHVVLAVADVSETWAWWQSNFGLIASDEVRAPNDMVAAMFIRCDRGPEPVDHHTLNFAAIPGVAPRFHHAAFEVADLDDLMAGSQHLVDKGYTHDWGVGRHILGSQVFDYWKDPFGHRVEHWTDGDLFDATVATNVVGLDVMMGRQWGPAAPHDFA